MSGHTPRVLRQYSPKEPWQPEKTFAWRVDFGDGSVIWTEHEDSAHLIAAAPELLEAAKAIYEDIIGTPSEERTYEGVNTAIFMLCDAIKKAEGKS